MRLGNEACAFRLLSERLSGLSKRKVEPVSATCGGPIRFAIPVLLLLSGCPASDDADTGDGTSGTDEPVVIYDCDAVPIAPTQTRLIAGARAYHGLAFDSAGRLVGSDGNALIRTQADGTSEVWIPGLGELEQIVFLPTGELVVSSAENGGLWKLSEQGGREILVGDHFAYGVVLGPNGKLYTSGRQGISRVDPEDGTVETLADESDVQNNEPHAIGFGLNNDRLYAGVITFAEEGTEEQGAPVFEWSVDSSGGFSVGPSVLVPALGGGWHDTMGVDACGNLYIADFWTTTLYRVTPTGGVTSLVNWEDPFGTESGTSDYGHALLWGSGADGWREDALYLSMPFNGNQVQEIVVGIPGKDWGGDVLNR
jgi:hypothetical protein